MGFHITKGFLALSFLLSLFQLFVHFQSSLNIFLAVTFLGVLHHVFNRQFHIINFSIPFLVPLQQKRNSHHSSLIIFNISFVFVNTFLRYFLLPKYINLILCLTHIFFLFLSSILICSYFFCAHSFPLPAKSTG